MHAQRGRSCMRTSQSDGFSSLLAPGSAMLVLTTTAAVSTPGCAVRAAASAPRARRVAVTAAARSCSPSITSTSGSTMGTSPAACAAAANSASWSALANSAAALGREPPPSAPPPPSPSTRNAARHFANVALHAAARPRRARRPSMPLVTVSPARPPSKGTRPLSTLRAAS
eukprot:351328-Chlamydomonas_euryale.AAC.12